MRVGVMTNWSSRHPAVLRLPLADLCRFIHAALITAVLILMSSSPLAAEARLQVTGTTMGTYFAVTIDSPSETDTEASVRAEIMAKLTAINAQMSTWDPKSEISRFNRSQSLDWFPVSPGFATVVKEAKTVHQLSGGAFDSTVAPLIDLWGFGKPGRSALPDQAAIDCALQSVGMQYIEVQMEPPALRRKRVAVQLNLSAIAKGYAVDVIAELLNASGRSSFIVDIGGETRAGAAKSSGDAWRVGVESPGSGLDRSRQPSRIIPITESSVATSGDYRNYFEVDGDTYSHTINPATGRPVESPPASVSVIHNSCMTADALATAMMVLGRERGIQLAVEQGYSVLFQFTGENDEIVQQGTGVFVTTTNGKVQSSESWTVFVAAGVMFLIAVTGMSAGILFSNRQISGSCGGLATLSGGEDRSICELCSVPREECVNDERREQMRNSDSEA